ncbi:hypothetical protein IU459_25310 [Nocardia amamiensis]|uniref:Uncharacterized protein n=1 Tax=Nocardia amamiensis TaxID=404578 RepID=A0ABS0D139_9NOCA|nr:hypothetical protein [Nocardia amamiensis]MBF6300839.1 hypothetical protein [Nocardia amamiensis]
MIDAPPQQILAVLLDPLTLPEWNAALTTVAGARVALMDGDYRITVLSLPGHLTYRSIRSRMVRIAWQVAGFARSATGP